MEINTITLTGNLCKNPELKHTPGGKPVCNLRIASNDKYKDGNGELHEKTLYIDVDVWGYPGELCNMHLSKGDQIAVTGRIDYETWQSQDGSTRNKHKLVAHIVKFLRKSSAQRPDVSGNFAIENEY